MSRVRDISGSCLSPKTGYSDRVFVGFIISMLSPTSFQNSYPMFSAGLMIVKWVKLKLKKTKLFYIYIVFICVRTK
jgi:hypothetical protein